MNEIDESIMIKRKYQSGDLRQQHDQWVSGLYDQETKKGWIQCVPQRDEATLLPSIQQFICPGSTVYSDGWAAYNNIANHGYVHGRVIHQNTFVDPVTGVHTQGVESYWSRAKQKIKAVYGSRLYLVPSYLDDLCRGKDLATIQEKHFKTSCSTSQNSTEMCFPL